MTGLHSVAVGPHRVTLDVARDLYGLEVNAAATAEAPPIARPRQSLVEGAPARRVSVRSWHAALGASADVRRALRRPGLTPLLAVAGPTGQGQRDAETLRLALDLWSILPWLPFDGLCLARSALLMAYLRRLGHGADWVFGVRLWPFEAHCWVQLGDTALNDQVERLVAFTPLMVR